MMPSVKFEVLGGLLMLLTVMVMMMMMHWSCVLSAVLSLSGR